MQIQITAVQSHSKTRDFVVYLQVNSLIRLHSDNEFVCGLIQICPEVSIVQIPRHMSELYPDLSPAERQENMKCFHGTHKVGQERSLFPKVPRTSYYVMLFQLSAEKAPHPTSSYL